MNKTPSISTMVSAPTSEQQLLERAWQIAGLTLSELASQLNLPMPENLLRHKGWIGETLEKALGATATSKPEPDFQLIGVELKTIPIKPNRQPKETTHVCTVPIINTEGMTWENSLVKTKLNRVLWIPIEYDESINLSKRRIGSPLLWSPNQEQEAKLRTDWEEFMELISQGEVEKITAHLGDVIQIRPKAANSSVLSETIGADGRVVKTLPRGFYLRTSFTAELIKQHYL